MAWKFTSDRPIYLQVTDIIMLDILRGVYPLGSRFPSVRDIAAAANINPNTAQRALGELEEKKLVITNGTSGRIVTTDNEIIEHLRNALVEQEVKEFYKRMRFIGIKKEELIQIINKLEE